MTEEKSKQIQAIDLAKGLFEHIHGNLGLLRFSIEKMIPKNGIPNNPDANKWEIILSFYKTLSSQSATRYLAEVDLNEKAVSINEIDGLDKPINPTKTKYTFTEVPKVESTADMPEVESTADMPKVKPTDVSIPK